MNNKPFSYLHIYLIIAIILAIAALFAVGASVYRGVKALEERTLISRAETIALSLEPREIMFLTGGAIDAKNPFYASLKRRFEKLREGNNDVRFIYLAGMRPAGAGGTGDNNIFFYLDSEPEDSPDYSPPGQVYEEASSVFYEVFKTRRSRFEGPLYDRWGEWVTVFTPIENPLNGKVLAVIGMDIKASEYRNRIALAMAAPILFVVLLFLAFLVGYVRYWKEKEILMLKAEFVSIASHELRSPLTGMAWALQSLLSDKTAVWPSNARDTLLLMNKTAADLLETVKNILDFSRLEYSGLSELKLSEIDIFDLIRESMATLALFAREKNIAIFFNAKSGETAICAGDREKIKRAISNIIANAIKYSPNGENIFIDYQKQDKNYIVNITNMGPSIPQSDQNKIFGKFFRVRDIAAISKHGTGLGLYFAKQIIEAHGGKIWFESPASPTFGAGGKQNTRLAEASAKRVGTTFYIMLPAQKPKAHP